MKKIIVLTCIFTGLFFQLAVAQSTGIEIIRAQWRGESQTLEVYASEGRGRETLTVYYNYSSSQMEYNRKMNRYELRLGPVCYSDTVTVRSSSGDAATEPVSDIDGMALDMPCSPQASEGDDDHDNGNMLSIRILRAEWRGNRETLYVSAEEGNGTETLTVFYNGSTTTMEYNSSRNRYDLMLSPVCYESSVIIESTSGDKITENVADTFNMGSTELCTDNYPACQDQDGDGFEDAACGGTDCNDGNAGIYPGATEICNDGIDQSCSGQPDTGCSTEPVCADLDGDGFKDAACGGTDCNDGNAGIHPGASEICYDGIDQSCSGEPDLGCSQGPHTNLSFAQYPDNCISCHQAEAEEVSSSTHYNWMGDTPDMVNQTGTLQGKLNNAVNSYCINILGDWPVCGSCHVGRGKRPDNLSADLTNIDCLVCHNRDYAAQRTRLSDGSMGVASPIDSMVRNISKPDRSNCLNCHAKAGGGDAVKRGDLSLALINNTDSAMDVHMNGSSSDLTCQACHQFKNHRVIGKGSDLRPTDDVSRGARVNCTTCHENMDSSNGHSANDINHHIGRVSCQTCHIPYYAKVPTEVHRDWLFHHDGTHADGKSGPGHPFIEKASDLIPEYRFWNGRSDNALLEDDASRTYDSLLDTYPTSRPVGDINGVNSKLYPFKYKTALQPKTTRDDRLIAIDTFEYIKGSGDVTASIESGLQNMGYPADEPYEWVTTDTYQLLNHGVDPSSGALNCDDCHSSSARIDLQGELGYAPKASQSVVCSQCHERESGSFDSIHRRHVQSRGYDCSYCHTFSRPERGLRMP